MILLKKLLPEITLMHGHAQDNRLKDMFDQAFRDGVIKKKYRKLFMSDEDEAKGQPRPDTMVRVGVDRLPADSKRAKNQLEKNKELNEITPEVLEMLDKYPIAGSSGNYVMIVKKKGHQLNLLLCDKSAKFLTEFFVGVIRIEKYADELRYTPKNAFGMNAYAVHWSNVAAEHMGQGIGRLMYRLAYEYITNQLNAAMVSDSILYEGSQKMWMLWMPGIANFYGMVFGDIFFPLDQSEINKSTLRDAQAVFAMKSPPTAIRKIAHNVKGLSFTKGEFGVMRVNQSINYKIQLDDSQSRFEYDERKNRTVEKNKDFAFTYFSNLVDESTGIAHLIKKMDSLYMDRDHMESSKGELTGLKACIFAFDDANVIVKKVGAKLVMVAV